MKTCLRIFVTAFVLLTLVGCTGRPPADRVVSGSAPKVVSRVQPRSRPNILLIVADDLGYSDLGIYGSEINTPNLDALASGGVRFTDFYASPMCSTTRAMLLTGVDHHPAGLGNLVERMSENQKGKPGYEGRLNNRVATLGEILQDAGYDTYMAGKWHLGSGSGADPSDRGFDRSFALLESGAGHFDNMMPLLGPGKAEYSEDGVRLEVLPDGFYSSRFYARKLIQYLGDRKQGEKPFFAYLAFTAPHFPLQARRETIAKYAGHYEHGYDVTHAERLRKMQSLGLVAEGIQAFPQLATESSWSSLSAEERKRQARVMEIYAAMIDDLDYHVGEVIDHLRSTGQYDNTVIFFLSDNGAEGHYLPWGLDPLVPWAESCCDNGIENLGDADSYQMLGPNWARVAVAPLRMFKGFTSEGGIRVPAFAHYPARFPAGGINRSMATVKDIVPTVLDLVGTEPPGAKFRGRDILPVQGRSLVPLLEGTVEDVHGPDYAVGWEVFGKRGLRQGNWKIVWENRDVWWWDSAALSIRRNAWQLYDLSSDPAELNDLSSAYPDRLASMTALWERYAQENGVIIPDRQRGY